MKQHLKSAGGPVGLGVAACAACCAGPIVGLIGGLGLTATAGAWLLGSTAIAAILAVLTIGYLVTRRAHRQRAARCAPETLVHLDAPVRRTSTAARS